MPIKIKKKQKKTNELRGSSQVFTAELLILPYRIPQRCECKWKQIIRITNHKASFLGADSLIYMINSQTVLTRLKLLHRSLHLSDLSHNSHIHTANTNPNRWIFTRGQKRMLEITSPTSSSFNSLLMKGPSHAWAKWAAPHMVPQPRGMSVLVSCNAPCVHVHPAGRGMLLQPSLDDRDEIVAAAQPHLKQNLSQTVENFVSLIFF